MPSNTEKDAYSGQATTGHEWDGIKELDTPLPRWWLWVLYATIAWSFVYFVLYPAIPGLTSYSKGVLGYSSRVEVGNKIAAARAEQGRFRDGIRQSPLAEIRTDDQLLRFALAGGKAAFADNCAPCHGVGGVGNPGGYPSLADDAWIWGGSLEDIERTILYGVRNDHEDSRSSQMPIFGRGEDAVLTPDQIADVAEFVLSMSKRSKNAEAMKRGAPLYKENCASCHGPTGKGDSEQGAPRLNDAIWIHGGSREAIIAQITRPKNGTMPAWSGRLDTETIKMLTVYVHALGGGQ
ncbi:MAG: cytochrome-c oxidase, cbb3-type subunit III [Rhodospirillaceae bacterium]|nr:cytochrome-c oxidase, cbb3-type subunit III [Rhodospirillaceae bacterium]